MLLADILNRKGSRVYSVKPGTSIRETVDAMVQNKIGAILVYDPNQNPIMKNNDEGNLIAGKDETDGNPVMVGIFTERDNLRATADRATPLEGTIVDDVMTRAVIGALPSFSLRQAMSLMTERRIRHLPVIEKGKLLGIVSIGDIVKALIELQEAEIDHLKNYIQS
ncbi:CBS domain-containing protein [bacterium]|nr:CBS domain-containing protein [bacterium]